MCDATQKTMVGSPLPSLGLRVDGDARKLDCPEGKRDMILADAAEQKRWAVDELRVDRRRANRLVGRLCNLSQVAPALRASLHGGYAVTQAAWVSGGRRRAPRSLLLSRDSPAYTGWVELLDAATDLIQLNQGVSLAPPLAFPHRRVAATLTSVTDASGTDGVGGYAYLAGRPHEVWIMSEVWPREMADALAASASPAQAELRRAGSAAQQPWCSTPVAELFGVAVLPRLVARLERVARVYAVGDCEAAARAYSASHSGNPKMRAILPLARDTSRHCVGVHVPREANVDCDRLSHPHMLDEVVAEAEAAGFRVHRVRPQPEDWDVLRAAIAAQVPKPRRKRRAPA